jgi:hypothetical protein
MRAWKGLWVVATVAGIAASAAVDAQDKGAKAPAGATVVTGEHRGYTNDKLHFTPEGGKEITLLVQIPGDKEGKWRKDHQIFSRITVTYTRNPDGSLVATSIKAAAK